MPKKIRRRQLSITIAGKKKRQRVCLDTAYFTETEKLLLKVL